MFCLFFLFILGFSHVSAQHDTSASNSGWTFVHYVEATTETYPPEVIGAFTYPERTAYMDITVTPTVPHPSTIRVTVSTYMLDENIVFEKIELEPGNGQPIVTPTNPGHYTSYQYSVMVVYTRLPSCTSSMPPSVTRTFSVHLPTDVNDVITAASESTSVTEYGMSSEVSTTTIINMYVEETQFPRAMAEHYRLQKEPLGYGTCEHYYYHGDGDYSNCLHNPIKVGSIIIGGRYKCSNGIYEYGMKPFQFGLVILFSWTGLILAIGFLHIILRFQDLMTGGRSSRGIPFVWSFAIPLLTFPLLLFYRSGFVARSREDRALLRTQWKTTPFKHKVRLWLRYGFTYEYPPMLGSAPEPPIPIRMQRPPTERPSSAREQAHEPPPPPYTRNTTPPPPHPDAARPPAAYLGTSRPESPPKYESD